MVGSRGAGRQQKSRREYMKVGETEHKTGEMKKEESQRGKI